MGITYAQSGVDINAYEEAKDEFAKIIQKANSTSPFSTCVIAGLGAFGAVFDTPKAAKILGIKHYADVESIDSVGTKVKIAAMMDRFDTLGLDMVGHSSGDIMAQGGLPLVFGDYIAFDKIERKRVIDLISGMAKGCQEVGIILHFGETAELPGVYQKNEFDLVGTIRGIVDKDNVITGKNISEGDVLIGIQSNGLHTNGYSLVRKIFFEKKKYSVGTHIKEFGTNLGQELLRTHRNYALPLKELFPKKIIKGIAHITGGGLPDNVIRILPRGVQAIIKKDSWESLAVFRVLQKEGHVPDDDMFHTFNMGVGLVVVVSGSNISKTKEVFSQYGMKAFEIGSIRKGERRVVLM